MNLKNFKHLNALGFSDYEIKAYVALLAQGAMNGYQLAKISGVPRPNIYSVLEKLIERGAVSRSSVGTTSEYQALPAEEMLNRLSHAFKTDVDGAKSALKNLDRTAAAPLAWNVKGHDALMSKAHRMIESAKDHVLVGLWPQEAAVLAGSLKRALESGVKPTVLCMFGCEQECGGCCGQIYRYPMSDGKQRSLILTTDRDQTLIAQINADGSAVGVHSDTAVLASVISQYLTNAIAVSEIVRSLGPKLLAIIDKNAMSALKGAGLALDHTSWFDRIHQIVKTSHGGIK
jgi:predicted transcriptional regulator